MAAAARVGDLTNHGTPLSPGPGSAVVSIGGQPAWRASMDTHTCPLTDGPAKPHVGGVVVQGSFKVFIDKMPAARAGDLIVESGQSNAVAAGYSAVQIGG
jgi:uncharacterized Zn-binding protein involved in type VI secretion